MTTTVTMHVGDVAAILPTLDAGSAHLLVTSPPFLALRSYLPADHPLKHAEIGSEPTPAAFLDTMYGLTAEWSRIIPEWGSVCVELGDTMSGSGGAGGDYNDGGLREGQAKFDGSAIRERSAGSMWTALADNGQTPPGLSPAKPGTKSRAAAGEGWPLAKSMCLIPHSYTLGLILGRNPWTGEPHPAGQWRIRNVICWARPNPPVGSLGKRNPDKRTGDYKFRPATSYITVACRGAGRYFDLDAVRVESVREARPNEINGTSGDRKDGQRHATPHAGAPPLDWHADDHPEDGDWLWKLPTAPYKGAHYATYPLELPRRLIRAMCPERVCDDCGWPSERITGATSYRRNDSDTVPFRLAMREGVRVAEGANQWTVPAGGNTSVTAQRDTLGFTDCGHDAWTTGAVLDCFGGSGTTAVAAALEGRNAVLVDLDQRNVALVRRRLRETVRIVDEVQDGNVITWTVETRLPDQTAQAEGQTNLLEFL